MIVSRINKHFIQNLTIWSDCGGCGSGRGPGPGGCGGEGGGVGVKITLSVYSAFPTILSILQFWLEKK